MNATIANHFVPTPRSIRVKSLFLLVLICSSYLCKCAVTITSGTILKPPVGITVYISNVILWSYPNGVSAVITNSEVTNIIVVTSSGYIVTYEPKSDDPRSLSGVLTVSINFVSLPQIGNSASGYVAFYAAFTSSNLMYIATTVLTITFAGIYFVVLGYANDRLNAPPFADWDQNMEQNNNKRDSSSALAVVLERPLNYINITYGSNAPTMYVVISDTAYLPSGSYTIDVEDPYIIVSGCSGSFVLSQLSSP
jgi:hypothetical protein